jgi:uncharacterized protein HemX
MIRYHQHIPCSEILAMLKDFFHNEAGAMTVDWVVLIAAVVGLGLVVYTFVQPQPELNEVPAANP